MTVLEDIKEATRTGDENRVNLLTKQAIDEGVEVDQIVKEGFIAAMVIVGKEFGDGKIYIPEMLIAARAMKGGLETVKPFIAGGKVKTIAKIVLGTVQGDLHDIGKNLVAMMLEGCGMEVIDLGVDVTPEKFVEALKTHKPKFVGMSALLTTTMTSMKATVEAMEEAGLRKNVKILVGGAPVSQAFADEIGADGFGLNASEAVERVKENLS
ncbi:MAG: corrinoid protein [Deltaproteobacteria bacterium]|nr:corrinoid protein [Deltaproteobacteria bacterium]